jgi:aryl-alcohol dehydrogenase-like predicted oxidoreductase
MKTKQLGNTDIITLPLSFGGNVFGWTIDEQTSFHLLDSFIGAGFTLIDTADVYSRWKKGNSGGESETIIGNWMKQRKNRNKVIIATKVGSDMGSGKKDLSKKYILKAADESLQRLQTDYIDLYQTHWDDEITPVEETLDAYAELIKAGKVKWIGASNLSPERLQASLDASKKYNLPLYQTLQPHYNLAFRKIFEERYEPICIKNNIGVITYFSLAAGFLTGKYRTEADLAKSPRGNGIKKYLNEHGLNILTALDIVSARYNTTPATIALAWLISKPAVSAPIASATSQTQLEAMMRSVEIVLDAEALEILDNASDEK